jgi:hypothetical protein
MVLLVLTYMALGTVIAVVTAPMPGTSLLLLGLEIIMIVHIARRHGQRAGIREIATLGGAIFLVSQFLKTLSVEILTFIPLLGWAAKPVVAAGAILVFALLANFYFSEPKKRS